MLSHDEQGLTEVSDTEMARHSFVQAIERCVVDAARDITWQEGDAAHPRQTSALQTLCRALSLPARLQPYAPGTPLCSLPQYSAGSCNFSGSRFTSPGHAFLLILRFVSTGGSAGHAQRMHHAPAIPFEHAPHADKVIKGVGFRCVRTLHQSYRDDAISLL